MSPSPDAGMSVDHGEKSIIEINNIIQGDPWLLIEKSN